jgi:pimeloyl-ACP methyl ester carboxylesterase
VIPGRVRRFILKNFFTPIPYKTSGLESDLLAKGHPFSIQADNRTIRCWRWGTGPAIIFVHGWNGRGIQFLPFFQPVLETGLSVITFDGPGHGEAEGQTSSYFQMTETLRALLRDNRIGVIRGLVGHSFGAGAIINALHKEKQGIPSVWIAPSLKLKELLEQAFSTHGIPLHIFRKLIAEYEEKYLYNLIEDNPIQLLSRRDMKALIIHDEDDRVIPLSDSREAADRNDGIRLETTKGLGHRRILKDPHVIHKTICYLKNDVL